jgi:hypothetical protein
MTAQRSRQRHAGSSAALLHQLRPIRTKQSKTPFVDGSSSAAHWVKTAAFPVPRFCEQSRRASLMPPSLMRFPSGGSPSPPPALQTLCRPPSTPQASRQACPLYSSSRQRAAIPVLIHLPILPEQLHSQGWSSLCTQIGSIDFRRDEPDMNITANSRIHLTRWPVTALAEKHRRQDHHPGLPGPRRPQPAGDANVSYQ